MEKLRKAGLFRAENIAPMLLSAAVVSSTAYIYACGNAAAVFLFAAISAIYSALLFAMYEKLRAVGKTWLTTVVVIAAFVAVQAVGFRLADMRSMNDLSIWFMEPSRYTQVHFGNTFTLISILGFVLVSCLYYFTKVRYRGVFVFLICLCPFCLFAKTFTSIPVIFPIIIMTLFFFIMTDNSGSEALISGRGKSVMMTTLAFVLAVTVIASFFPKLRSAPFREDFDEFITGVSIGAAGKADYNDFTDSSSSSTSKDDDSILFRFYGDNPVYIKRQCFNMYDRTENTWGYYGDSNNGNSNWRTFIRFEDPSLLYDALGFDTESISLKTSRMQYEEGIVKAVYTPDDLTDLELFRSDQYIYRTELDEYFLSSKATDTVQSYSMEWADFVPDKDFSELFTDECAQELAESTDPVYKDAASYLRMKEQAMKYDSLTMSDIVMDKCFSSPSARAKVRELAESITAPYDFIGDKASAIVDYFRSGEYIYDNDFTTANAAPDNFIFNTKRGACAAYATAMTLMCRELGMTARYCEGFLVQKYDAEGGYWYVTAGDSHAFVQVWIDGYGWTTFDPTSSTKDDGYFDMTFVYVGVAAAVMFLIGVLIVMLRPVFEERGFVRRMKSARGTPQYSMIYRRINAALNSYIKSPENRLTPTDTAEKVRELFGLDIGGFVQCYEAAIYGASADESADNSDVYTAFMQAYKARKREDKKRK
ncbi:MAG: transglutaminase domain-containing protein [Ruminiclostridium sp.]|nr:transglutaminase domain-containing protein [Ruminiclostridium sp.]